MIFFRTAIASLLTAIITSAAIAQNSVGPLMLDPGFANGGKSEVDFGADSAVATCYVAYRALPRQFNRIVVAGKVYLNHQVEFAIGQFDSAGVAESTFGTDGISNLSWSSNTSYPNATCLLPNGTLFAAGSSSPDPPPRVFPNVFKIQNNGKPDSSFGLDGRKHFQPPATTYLGEFENIDTLRKNNVLLLTALGYVHDQETLTAGFYAARFDSLGTLDSSFGNTGNAIERAPVQFAKGFLIPTGIIFGGITDTGTFPKILLCKLHSNGNSDSSFGTNGVLNTGITLHESNTLSSIYDPDTSAQLNLHAGLLVAAPVSGNMPFTVLKFKLDGTLDSTFGVNGYATAPIISNMTIRGLNLSNDGSILVSGSVGSVSAAAKFFPNGVIDTTFGTKGVAMLDADSGERANYLIGFVPAPLPPPHGNGTAQRFLGIGVSHTANGSPEFLLARYMPVKYAAVTQPNLETPNSLELFPNPVHNVLNVESRTGAVEELTITDALGRIVRSFARPDFATASSTYFVDLSGLTAGVYSCSVRTTNGVAARQFTVLH